MLKVGKLAAKSRHYANPDTKARLLAHSSLDFYRACALANEHQWQDDGLPFTSFLLPAMHQTLELGAKAIASLADPTLRVKSYQHETLRLLAERSDRVPVFSVVLSINGSYDLLSNLETAYLGMKYGECYSDQTGEAWQLFDHIAELFFQDLSNTTGLRFPMAHRLLRDGA